MKRSVAGARRNKKSSSNGRAASGNVGAEQALHKEAHEYAQALTKRDVEALDKVWTPDYTFVNPRGELLSKGNASPT
jgi:Domain of unknown function (DUF4440)